MLELRWETQGIMPKKRVSRAGSSKLAKTLEMSPFRPE
jgi:hypothetical protein